MIQDSGYPLPSYASTRFAQEMDNLERKFVAGKLSDKEYDEQMDNLIRLSQEPTR